MTEVPKQLRARCVHCGSIQYFREDLMYLDRIALCCSKPSYWAVEEYNKMVR